MSSNLPPGVSEHMIPGNRPEDLEIEEFFERLEEKLVVRCKQQKIVNRDDLFDDDLVSLVAEISYSTGKERGFDEGRAEEAMARSLKEEHEWYTRECDVCGEKLEDNPRAEVVLKSTKFLHHNPHLIVHAESCYNEETMEQA